MERPKNFTSETGFQNIVEPGAHSAVILKCSEKLTKDGGCQFVADIDLDSNDKNCGYFSQLAKKFNGKWPFQGTAYVYAVDKNGYSTEYLNNFISAIQVSNPGFTVTWGDEIASSFVGKRIGVIYQEVEEYNATLGTSICTTRISGYCNVALVDSIPAPPKKILKKSFLVPQKVSAEKLKEMLNIR